MVINHRSAAIIKDWWAHNFISNLSQLPRHNQLKKSVDSAILAAAVATQNYNLRKLNAASETFLFRRPSTFLINPRPPQSKCRWPVIPKTFNFNQHDRLKRGDRWNIVKSWPIYPSNKLATTRKLSFSPRLLNRTESMTARKKANPKRPCDTCDRDRVQSDYRNKWYKNREVKKIGTQERKKEKQVLSSSSSKKRSMLSGVCKLT